MDCAICAAAIGESIQGDSEIENGKFDIKFGSAELWLKPGFHVVVPVARIVAVASNFWKRHGRSYGNALAITQDDPCDRNDQSSEIDSSSILATETTGKDSVAIAYFEWKPGSNDRSDRSAGTYPMMQLIVYFSSIYTLQNGSRQLEQHLFIYGRNTEI